MPYTKLGDINTLTLSNKAQCDNPCCILTLNNDVILMGNIFLTDYESGEVIAILPSSMRPSEDIFIPVYLDTSLVRININNKGEIIMYQDATGGLYLNGITFNVCDQYYNETIGNNFSQGTSPLRWDGEPY